MFRLKPGFRILHYQLNSLHAAFLIPQRKSPQVQNFLPVLLAHVLALAPATSVLLPMSYLLGRNSELTKLTFDFASLAVITDRRSIRRPGIGRAR
jgi:hypothetical protein